jgi:hypothetical protein
MRLLFLAVLLTVSAPAALAANPDLRRALKLYDNLDYMPALDALEAADARAKSTAKEKVQIQIYVGMISMALGDEARARRAFAKAIALDRSAQAPASASPKVAAILDQLREQAPVEPADGQPIAEQPPAQAAPNPYPYYPSYYPPQQTWPAQAQPVSPTPGGPYPAPSVAVTPLPDTRSSNAWSAVTGFTALGLGIAGVAVGAGLQVFANNDAATGSLTTTSGPVASVDQSNINQAWTGAMVGYVAGGVLLAGGVTLLIVHYAAGTSPPAPHAGALSVTPGGVALAF